MRLYVCKMRKPLLLLTSMEIWVIGVCAAASFVSERFLPLAVGSMGVFGLIRCFVHRRFSIRTPIDWPVILLILMLLVTLWVTGSLIITIPQVLRLLTGIGLYFGIVNWTNSTSRIRWLVRGVWFTGLMIALYAFISVQWNSTKLNFIPVNLYTHFTPHVNDTANPNVMAGTLIILLPCALGLLWFCGLSLGWIDLSLASLSVVIGTFVLILTQSRGGILALGETLVLMVVLRWRRGLWLLAGVVVLIGVLVILLGPTSIIEGILANASLGGIDGRLEVWSRAIYMVQDFPFTGVGIGSYGRVGNLLYPFFLYATGTPPHAHNLFLQIAVDLGIPGLIAWLAIWMLIMLTAWLLFQHGRKFNNKWSSGLGAGLLCSQIALVSHGMLDAVTWGMVKPAPLVWVLWGITVAGWYVHGRGK